MIHIVPPATSTRRRARAWLVIAGLCIAAVGCHGDDDAASDSRPPAVLPSMMPQEGTNADASPPEVPFSSATPVTVARARASWPHDTAAYTQGLTIAAGRLLESTGREGRSDVREVRRETGAVVRRTALPRAAFGEGLAVTGGRAFQLTWKGGRGYVYDAATLARVDSFPFSGEGWGLAADDSLLYMTDGSSAIRVIDPRGFRELRRVTVREANKPVWMLNELEMVRGELWANIYETDMIARIRPATGDVIGFVNLAGLLTAKDRAGVTRRGGTANGIAFDPARGTVLVTGKLWPRIFELDVKSLSPASGK